MGGLTLNWTALLTSLAGATVGGLTGVVVAGARNKPLEGPVLVGAALGAIVASIAVPKALPMS
jgi:hypothetical protein